jgi:hypothetical protein
MKIKEKEESRHSNIETEWRAYPTGGIAKTVSANEAEEEAAVSPPKRDFFNPSSPMAHDNPGTW